MTTSGTRPQAAPELASLEKPTPFADIAFEELRRELLPGGALFDWSRLVEAELARRLGMSRTPVREALHRLALVGILEPTSGGGYVPRRFSRREVQDHYELRILLEPVAAELAAEAPEAVRGGALDDPDLVGGEVSAEANTRFHKAIARLSGNRSLTRIIERLVDRLAREGVYARGTTRQQRTLASAHGRILRHIVDGRPEEAAALMHEHLRMALNVLLSSRTSAGFAAKQRARAVAGDGEDSVLTRERLGEGAYSHLRAAILEGRLPPGSLLNEAAIAEALNVSRTPTRFALRQLEAEGYADRDKRGRLVVHQLTRTELQELFTVRKMLEGEAASRAAVHISDDELDRLDHLLAADLDALRAGDVGRLAALNEEIHAAVLKASRSHVLVQVANEVRERVHGFGFSAFAVGQRADRRHFVEEHAALVRAVREGDGMIAAQVVERHIERALRLLVDGFARYEAKPTT